MADGQVADIAALTQQISQVREDIAVLTERIAQACKENAAIQANVAKLANGQETRLRALEKYQAKSEERWANHLESTRQAWEGHAEVHKDLKFKDRLADGANFIAAIIAAAVAAVIGSNN